MERGTIIEILTPNSEFFDLKENDSSLLKVESHTQNKVLQGYTNTFRVIPNQDLKNNVTTKVFFIFILAYFST
jgi:hypothetical protein